MQLETIYSLIKDKIKATERLMREELRSDVPVIHRMGTYITQSGGKRIRPAVLCLSAKSCGYEGDKDVRFGVVFEFVHTATLIHDDIIDNSDLRRGRRVMNKKFGTTLSILFGDYLFNVAMEMALRDDDFRIVRLINKATDKMIQGEIIQSERNYSADLSLDDYMDLIERKTAYVFASAAQAAPILAGSGTKVEEEFFEYGMNLGIAFQLIDDYFDYASTEEKLGKPVGSDLREGKITYPILTLLERSGKKPREVVKRCFDTRSVREEDLQYLLTEMRECGALEATKESALQYASKAAKSLTLLEDSAYLDALRELPVFVVERNK